MACVTKTSRTVAWHKKPQGANVPQWSKGLVARATNRLKYTVFNGEVLVMNPQKENMCRRIVEFGEIYDLMLKYKKDYDISSREDCDGHVTFEVYLNYNTWFHRKRAKENKETFRLYDMTKPEDVQAAWRAFLRVKDPEALANDVLLEIYGTEAAFNNGNQCSKEWFYMH